MAIYITMIPHLCSATVFLPISDVSQMWCKK